MQEQFINRNWIEYTEGPGTFVQPDRIYASLSQRGEILVNRQGMEDLGWPAAVVLLFEPETRTIALRPAPADTPHAFAIRRARNRAGTLCSLGFMRRHDIRLPNCARIRFPTARIEHGVLIMELEFATAVVRTGATRPA